VGALLGEVVGAHPLPAARPGASPARPPRCSPSTSLFLVSTQVTGWLAAANSLTWPLRYRTWVSRSGWRAPSVVREVPSQGEPLGLGAARPPCPRPPGAPAGSARRPASGWTCTSSATGPPGPHPDPARPAPAGPGPDPDRARAAVCGPHPPPAPGRPAHRPTQRAPRATVDSATRPTRATRRTPHTPTPGQPLPTPGAAAAHPDGAAARRTPPRAPPRSVSSRRDPMAQLPHQTHQLLIGDSLRGGERCRLVSRAVNEEPWLKTSRRPGAGVRARDRRSARLVRAHTDEAGPDGRPSWFPKASGERPGPVAGGAEQQPAGRQHGVVAERMATAGQIE
jgi:hypothetical protein